MHTSKKIIVDQKEWSVVVKELEAENFKLASYDDTLMSAIGDITNKKVLDFGAGPGVLALGLQKMGADVKVWDINNEMRKKAGVKIGMENIYSDISQVPQNFFDAIICNLVLCIVPEAEVRRIVKYIKNFLNETGLAYIGFCNPKIFTIAESHLDFRFPTGHKYEENHNYKKIKKEGGYEIIETHRPIEWYEKVYAEAGLESVDTFFTPEYEFKGNRMRDFVIFKLRK
jgi:ubiquinone/menaquinone biosynthesis C-methylase UbiE